MPVHRKTKHDRSINYTTAKLLRDGGPGVVLWQEENATGPSHQGSKALNRTHTVRVLLVHYQCALLSAV